MTMLKREDAARLLPVLPRRTVLIAELGAEVIVRGMLLSERMALSAMGADLAALQPGETAQQAQARAGREVVFFTLSRCVVLADDAPLFTAAQWDAFGAQHPGAVLDLYKQARQLGGYEEDDNAKN